MVPFNTFSIVARCPHRGMFGVAVATCVPAVGTAVPHMRAGVGAIASQAWSNPYLGMHGVDLLTAGGSAASVVEALTRWDPDAEHRQISIVDRDGSTCAHTGVSTKPYSGHREGTGVVVAGNMLAGPAVLDDMLATFEREAGEPFELRLLAALQAGQDAGGDARGKQSAALKVVWREEYPYVDIRVDEHSDPIPELRRIYSVCERDLFPYRERRPKLADLVQRSGATAPTLMRGSSHGLPVDETDERSADSSDSR